MSDSPHSRVLRASTEGFSFWCPGCHEYHHVNTRQTVPSEPGGAVKNWEWNGDMDRPTFSPSVLVTGKKWVPRVTYHNIEQWRLRPWVQTQVPWVCHSFVENGVIRFLDDCSHELRGVSVPLPEWPRRKHER